MAADPVGLVDPVEDPEVTRQRAMWDYEGADQMEGTYPFTIERSVKGFRLNHFLHSLTDPAVRKKFREDEEATMLEAGLTDEERRLVRERDWIGMIHYGVIFFMLEKLGAVTGIGHQLSVAQELFSVADVFAWTIVLVALLFLLEAIVARVETRLLRWRA